MGVGVGLLFVGGSNDFLPFSYFFLTKGDAAWVGGLRCFFVGGGAGVEQTALGGKAGVGWLRWGGEIWRFIVVNLFSCRHVVVAVASLIFLFCLSCAGPAEPTISALLLLSCLLLLAGHPIRLCLRRALSSRRLLLLPVLLRRRLLLLLLLRLRLLVPLLLLHRPLPLLLLRPRLPTRPLGRPPLPLCLPRLRRRLRQRPRPRPRRCLSQRLHRCRRRPIRRCLCLLLAR